MCTAVHSTPSAALVLVQAALRPPPPRPRNVRPSSLRSANSNISDLEDEDSDSPGGCNELLDADRLAVAADFPAEPPLGRFSDCFAIFAMRLRSMFSSGGNRRHNASPIVGSTSCRHRTVNLMTWHYALVIPGQWAWQLRKLPLLLWCSLSNNNWTDWPLLSNSKSKCFLQAHVNSILLSANQLTLKVHILFSSIWCYYVNSLLYKQ